MCLGGFGGLKAKGQKADVLGSDTKLCDLSIASPAEEIRLGEVKALPKGRRPLRDRGKNGVRASLRPRECACNYITGACCQSGGCRERTSAGWAGERHEKGETRLAGKVKESLCGKGTRGGRE